MAERFDSGARLRVEAHLLRPPILQQLHLVGQLALDRRDPLDLFSGELPLGLGGQDGVGDVDPAVRLNQRWKTPDEPAGDEQVDVVVSPVAQGQVR